MKRSKEIEAVLKGARLMERLKSWDKIHDWLEIENLSHRKANAWVYANNNGINAPEARMDKMTAKAREICDRNGWTLDTSNLYMVAEE